MCKRMVQYSHSLGVDLWVGIGVVSRLACPSWGWMRYSLHREVKISTTRCCCSWQGTTQAISAIKNTYAITDRAEMEFYLPLFCMKNEEYPL